MPKQFSIQGCKVIKIHAISGLSKIDKDDKDIFNYNNLCRKILYYRMYFKTQYGLIFERFKKLYINKIPKGKKICLYENDGIFILFRSTSSSVILQKIVDSEVARIYFSIIMDISAEAPECLILSKEDLEKYIWVDYKDYLLK